MITKDKYIADVIIVSYKNPELTANCVQSIRDGAELSLNIIIIDNASPDDTYQKLSEMLRNVQLIRSDVNMGYAGAINFASKHCASKYLIVSNNDVIFEKGVIDGLIRTLDLDSTIAVAGPTQQYGDGSWEICSGYLPGITLGLRKLFFIETISNRLNKSIWSFRKGKGIIKEVGYVDGAVMVIRRSVFDTLAGFDNEYFFYTEEADFCYRARKAGYSVVTNPRHYVTHLRGLGNSAGNLASEQIRNLVNSKMIFCRKHLTSIETKYYVKLEIMNCLVYRIILNILMPLSRGNLKAKILSKKRINNDFLTSWKHAKKDYFNE